MARKYAGHRMNTRCLPKMGKCIGEVIFVQSVMAGKSLHPKNKSFEIVKGCVADPFDFAGIAFFL